MENQWLWANLGAVGVIAAMFMFTLRWLLQHEDKLADIIANHIKRDVELHVETKDALKQMTSVNGELLKQLLELLQKERRKVPDG